MYAEAINHLRVHLVGSINLFTTVGPHYVHYMVLITYFESVNTVLFKPITFNIG